MRSVSSTIIEPSSLDFRSMSLIIRRSAARLIERPHVEDPHADRHRRPRHVRPISEPLLLAESAWTWSGQRQEAGPQEARRPTAIL
jgi:hypothetical protein